MARTIKRFVECFSHEVVATIFTMREAREFLACDAQGQLISAPAFDVAIVDGNLSWSYDGSDGREICELLAQLVPRPLSIGHSGGGAVMGADEQSPKGSSPEKLVALLNS